MSKSHKGSNAVIKMPISHGKHWIIPHQHGKGEIDS
jgi:hypothetical protein